MLTSQFLQVRVKSQVSDGSNDLSLICCVPSGLQNTAELYLRNFEECYAELNMFINVCRC